mgnify:CR=1 FL=1
MLSFSRSVSRLVRGLIWCSHYPGYHAIVQVYVAWSIRANAIEYGGRRMSTFHAPPLHAGRERFLCTCMHDASTLLFVGNHASTPHKYLGPPESRTHLELEMGTTRMAARYRPLPVPRRRQGVRSRQNNRLFFCGSKK